MPLNDCCRDFENLKESERRYVTATNSAGATRQDLLITRTCIVCGRRHHELNAEAGHLGLKFKDEPELKSKGDE